MKTLDNKELYNIVGGVKFSASLLMKNVLKD